MIVRVFPIRAVVLVLVLVTGAFSATASQWSAYGTARERNEEAVVASLEGELEALERRAASRGSGGGRFAPLSKAGATAATAAAAAEDSHRRRLSAARRPLLTPLRAAARG